jgi:hypothetical protein
MCIVQEGCLNNFVSISKLYKLLRIIFNVCSSEIEDLYFCLEGSSVNLSGCIHVLSFDFGNDNIYLSIYVQIISLL